MRSRMRRPGRKSNHQFQTHGMERGSKFTDEVTEIMLAGGGHFLEIDDDARLLGRYGIVDHIV